MFVVAEQEKHKCMLKAYHKCNIRGRKVMQHEIMSESYQLFTHGLTITINFVQRFHVC